MSTRTRTIGARMAAGTARPRGARPPAPGRLLRIARAVVLLCLLVTLVRRPFLNRMEAALATSGALPATPGSHALPARLPAAALRHAGAEALQHVLSGPWMVGVTAISAAGAGLMLLELGAAGCLHVLQTGMMRRRRGSALRIRAPLPRGAPAARTGSAAGDDLFRALHQVLPARGVLSGRAPWIALTLAGLPDQPAELGAWVGVANARRRRACVATVRKIIEGLAPGTCVEDVPDALAATLQPGTVVAWRELGLLRPPAYPLRTPEDTGRSDLLGPLAAALRPRAGTIRTELQLVLRPARGFALNRGWRAGALRLLLQLQSKADYALSPDMRAIEAKLGGAPYLVTIRLLAVARDQEQLPAAQAEIDEVTAVVGQYAARTGNHLQRLLPIADGCITVPEPLARLPRRWISMLLGGVATGLLTVHAAWRVAPVQAPVLRRWPTLALPALLSGQSSRLAAACVTVLAGAGVLLLARRQDRRGARQLASLLSRAPRWVPPGRGLLPVRPWRQADILSSNELAGLWHLPAPALGHLVRWLPCRHLAAPPQAFTAGAADRIVVGHARRSDGSYAAVGPTLRDLRQILHVTAGMGAGKSRLLANVCLQALKDGLTLIDGKGDDRAGSLVATVRQLIPLEDEGRLILLDVLDAGWPIGLNPLADAAFHHGSGHDLVLGQVLATFARIDPATWGKAVGMQQYLQMATLLVLEGEAHATLATVKQALVDAGYRARLLAQTRNPEVKTFWEITFPQLGESQKTSRDALLRRFDLLLTAETTRYLVTQALPTFDFLRAIEAGLIVLVPLPDMTLGGMAGVIGTLVLQAFVRAAFARAGSDQTRRSYPLVVDEFQVLVGTGDAHDVETALTRLRALGIPALYAHQALTQLGDLADLMRINAQNRLILQTQEPDASIYAQQFGASGVTAVDISQQDPGEHQYAALRCDGTPTGLFSIHPLPWPAPVAVAAPAYTGPDWRTVIPEDAPDRAYDREVLRLVYGTHAEPQQLGERLARGLSEREWRSLLERWEAIRLAQRAHILAHPGCIPDRLERQQWLSRLLVARPRILAEVEYYRQRPALAAPGATPARSRDGGHETRSKAAPVAVRAAEVADAQQETWSTQARADDALAPHAAPAEPPLPASQRFLE